MECNVFFGCYALKFEGVKFIGKESWERLLIVILKIKFSFKYLILVYFRIIILYKFSLL